MYDGSKEHLDTENFSWISITDDKLVITIKLIDDKLTVVNSVNSNFINGLEEDEFNELLFGTSDYDEIIFKKKI